MNEERALIIFAKLPRPGEVKTRLGKSIGMAQAAELYEEFARHTFGIGRTLMADGVRVHVLHDPRASQSEMQAWIGDAFDLRPQIGGDLGARMQHAFATVFANGGRKVVIVGTDVPELRVEHITNAFSLLSTNDVVLGRSHDGGYYLLGMRTLIPDVFKGVPWSTGDVYRTTTEKIRSLGLSLAELETVSDIDTEEDYVAYLRRKAGS